VGIVKLAWRRVVALFTRDSIDRDIEQELRLHVDLLAGEYQRAGMSPEDATRAALRRFGNVLQLRERGHDVRGFRMFEAVLRDVKYGCRGLIRTPVFTTTVVVTLALGIGANTAVFSLVHGFLIRPLPFPDADQLVEIYESIPGYQRASVSPANWLDWQRESRSFESFAAWSIAQATLTGGGEPIRILGQKASAELFRVMRVEPLVGRPFTQEDDQPGAAPVAIMSHRLWRQRFGEDPAIVGKTLELDGLSHRIVGVMPADFHLVMRDTDYWVPFALDRDQAMRRTEGRYIQVVGRVKPSVTPAAARAEMEAVARRLQLHPSNKDVSVTIVPLREVIGGDVRTPLFLLLSVVSVFLLVACFNVASMLLARSAARTREIAIRASLGAGRGAIVRQLLVESLLLALIGGVTGILIAYVVMNSAMRSDIAQVADVSVDRGVLLYALGLAVVTGIAFGLAPSLTITRGSVHDYLRRDAMPHGSRSRHMLVIAQIAMTVVLLCAGGLLVRSLNVLVGTKTGMDVENVLTMFVSLSEKRYDEAQRVEFFRQAVQRVKSLPGVESVAAAGSLPVVGAPLQDGVFHVRGTPLRFPSQDPSKGLRISDTSSGSLTGPFAKIRVATPGYFKTLGIPIISGRDFTEEEQRERVEPVFIVNEAFARKYLQPGDPLSASISVLGRPENPYGRVVGVAGDVYDQSPRLGAAPTIFYSHAHQPVSGMVLFVRGTAAADLRKAVIQTVRDLDRNQPVSEVRMLKEALGTSLGLEKIAAMASSGFALTALLLASLGVYGLLAYLVAERTREIGIRMALGAQTSTVVRMVVGRGLRLIAYGGALGLAGGLAVSQLIRGLLYGVTATDPVTFAGVIVLVVTVGTIAAVVPAIRAARVDPLIALRQE
jgi:putative ABC transport system permease protein